MGRKKILIFLIGIGIFSLLVIKDTSLIWSSHIVARRIKLSSPIQGPVLSEVFESLKEYLSRSGRLEISPHGVYFNEEEILVKDLRSAGINSTISILCPCSFQDAVIKISASIAGLSESEINRVLSATWNKFYYLISLKTPQAWHAIFLTLLSSDNEVTRMALGQIEAWLNSFQEIIDGRNEIIEESLNSLKYVVSNLVLETKVRKKGLEILSEILTWCMESPEIRENIAPSLRSLREWIYQGAQGDSELKIAFQEALSNIYLTALKTDDESVLREVRIEDLQFSPSIRGRRFASEILAQLLQKREYSSFFSFLTAQREYLRENLIVLHSLLPYIADLPNEEFNQLLDILIESNPPLDQESVTTLLELIALDAKRAQKLINFLILKFINTEDKDLPSYYFRETTLLEALNKLLYSPTLSEVWEDVVELIRVIPHPFTPFVTREPERLSDYGTLRELSRTLDETKSLSDPLMHYQRIILHGHKNYAKPTNRNVQFVEAILSFWLTGDPDILRQQKIPEDVIEELGDINSYVRKYQDELRFLFDELGISDVTELRRVPISEIRAILEKSPYNGDKTKCLLEIELYHRVVKKYLGVIQATVIGDLKRIPVEELDLSEYPEIQERYVEFITHINRAEESGEIRDYISAARSIVDLISAVKAFCTTPGEFRPQVIRDVVHKDLERLEYREPKFDLLNVLYYKLVDAEGVIYSRIREMLPAPEEMGVEDLAQAIDFLKVLARALYVRGYLNRNELSSVEVLTADTSDLKEALTHIKLIYNSILGNISEKISNFQGIFSWSPRELNTQIREAEARKEYLEHFRTMLAFISESLSKSSVLTASIAQSQSLGPIQIFSLHSPLTQVASSNIGAKAWSLVYLSHSGIDVPDAFFIPKELANNWFNLSKEEKMRILKEIVEELEKKTGKKFGQNLLLAVRSSPVIPHPGILLTMLNVGMNEGVRDELIEETGDERFGWENYRAWLFTWAVEFGGVSTEDLDLVMDEVKSKYGVGTKAQLPVEGIQEVVRKYQLLIEKTLREKGAVGDLGVEFPPRDPYEQLYLAVESALRSYGAPQAVAYRQRKGIPENSGMGVIIQEMRFGNYTLPPNQLSGSGTINVYSLGDMRGSFKPLALGTDIMSGLSSVGLTISSIEAPGGETLETLYPRAYEQLVDKIRDIYSLYGRRPVQIEFTFEKGQLYILQVRELFPEEINPEMSTSYVEIPRDALPLGRGVAVGRTPVVGIVITVEDLSDEGKLKELLQKVESDPEIGGLILVTPSVDSRDLLLPLAEHPEIIAFLSNRGYEVSHGVSIAHITHTTAILGIRNMERDDSGWKFKTPGEEVRIKSGDLITINTDGKIYLGKYPIRTIER